MSATWIAGLNAGDAAEWIDTEQRGLVLRVRSGQMVCSSGTCTKAQRGAIASESP
jgi:hypothetical protein